ncbi:MAG: AmmeMemoRadiSam system protein A [Desulfobacteraceae bacterium]|nr:AmmeMemoRadiSam system protein A [Desulfobacteraceae bacterium]
MATKPTEFVELSEQEGKQLLDIARVTISSEFNLDDSIKKVKEELKTNIFYENRGTFVTLYKKGNLRGCIGTLEPVESIIQGIQDNAINAAFKDPRFSPVKSNELKNIKIEISILTEPEKLKYSTSKDLLTQLKPFTHGVIIEKKHHKATFLPQVWDQLPDTTDFLSHLCMKAGLSANEWTNGKLEVMIYHVQYFKEE